MKRASHLRAALPGLAIAVVLAALPVGCSRERTYAALAGRVNAVVEPLADANEFSGAIVLMRRGRIIYQRGFGMANHSEGVAFTPDTPADGASLAKTLTAAGIWLLAFEKRIDMDAPVTLYLPEYPHADTTVRQLISHSNGLPPDYEFFDPYFVPSAVRTTGEMLRILAWESPMPAFPPGSRYEYSDLGFDSAALVIERVSGQSIAQFLDERFFSRLGMKDSFPRPARFADWPGVRTMGYRWRDGDWQVVDVFDGEAFIGGSNVYFSVADLARWASAHAAGRAIAPVAFATGQRRSVIDDRLSPVTGLSWYCDGSGKRCYYRGALNAFNGFAYWDSARNEAVAFIANSSVPPWKLIALERGLVAAIAGIKLPPDAPPEFRRFDALDDAAIAGAWRADGIGELTITSEPRLRLRVGQGLEFDMFPVGAEVFYVPGLDYWIAFSGADGQLAMHVRSLFTDAVARRAGAEDG